MDDHEEEVKAEVTPMAAKLERNRRELESLLAGINDVAAPVQLALDKDDPVPMNPLQIKSSHSSEQCSNKNRCSPQSPHQT